MRMREFIKENRGAIDEHVFKVMNAGRSTPVVVKMNDSEREQWIMNDESLYNWARRSGVRV